VCKTETDDDVETKQIKSNDSICEDEKMAPNKKASTVSETNKNLPPKPEKNEKTLNVKEVIKVKTSVIKSEETEIKSEPDRGKTEEKSSHKTCPDSSASLSSRDPTTKSPQKATPTVKLTVSTDSDVDTKWSHCRKSLTPHSGQKKASQEGSKKRKGSLTLYESSTGTKRKKSVVDKR
jgi:hypothetical protein